MKQRGMWPLLIVAFALILAACGGGSKGPATYTVSGTIVDADGEPIEGITLAFSDMTATAETDEDGNWTQTGLRGSVTVTPAFDGYTFDPESVEVSKTADDVHFTGTKDTDPGTDPDPQQPTGYTISGAVLDADYDPIEGVKVHVAGADIKGTTVATAIDGTWEATNLEGEVTVTPEHDDYDFNPVSLTLEGTTPAANFIGTETTATAPDETYAASGVVADEDGLPIADVTLHAAGPDIQTSATTTDRDGKWTVDGLRGEVTVTPEHDDYTFDPVSIALGGAISTANFVATETATTAPETPFTLSGIMVDNDGNPVRGATMTFEYDGRTATTKTDDDGEWTSPELRGTVVVTPSHSAHEFLPPSREASAADGDAMEFTALTPYPASGRVVDDEGDPISGVVVNIRHPEVFRHYDATVVTNPDGRWSHDKLIGQAEVGPRDPSYDIDARTIDEEDMNFDFEGRLRSCNVGSSMDDPNNPCEITQMKQINRIADEPDALDGHYILGASINASMTRQGHNYTPIGTEDAPFTGTFDGADHEIRGLKIDAADTDYVGLFGYIGGNAEIHNIHLVDLNITADAAAVGSLVGYNDGGAITNVSSDAWSSVKGVDEYVVVGGLIGINNGPIKHAHSHGDVKTSNRRAVGGLVGLNEEEGSIAYSSSGSTVSGRFDVGGLVGSNYGSIEQSYSDGSATGTETVGGLVGRNGAGAVIVATYSRADATSTGGNVGGLVGENWASVDMSYSTGAVDGNEQYGTGGLLGIHDEYYDVILGRSYYDTETSGQSDGHGLPRTTAQMTKENTYVGWDWTIWSHSPAVNDGYPFLQNNP